MKDNKNVKSFGQFNENLNISDVRSSSYIIKLDNNYYLVSNEKILKGDTYFFPKENKLRICETDMESNGVNTVRPEWVLKAVKFDFVNLD